jgi:AcrR family transcriptional regulator
VHTPTLTSGLRDQHRAQTLCALHDAAVGLAREGGLATATVDAITERSGVSRRTFFNYFPSKEDALLGLRAPRIPPEALGRFLAHSADDGFGEALRLVLAISASAFAVDLPAGERRRLMCEFPTLRTRMSQHMTAVEGLVAAALDEASGQGPPAAAMRDGESLRALLMLAGAVVRFADTDSPAPANPDTRVAPEPPQTGTMAGPLSPATSGRRPREADSGDLAPGEVESGNPAPEGSVSSASARSEALDRAINVFRSIFKEIQ